MDPVGFLLKWRLSPFYFLNVLSPPSCCLFQNSSTNSNFQSLCLNLLKDTDLGHNFLKELPELKVQDEALILLL